MKLCITLRNMVDIRRRATAHDYSGGMSAAKADLHCALQRVLRENPDCRYYDLVPIAGEYRTLLSIGKAQYVGISSETQQKAQQNAASNALVHVRGMAEEALRGTLGIPHRNHIAELDHVRDCLRQLKRRYKEIGDRRKRDDAFRHVGKLYQSVDDAERKLIADTGYYD